MRNERYEDNDYFPIMFSTVMILLLFGIYLIYITVFLGFEVSLRKYCIICMMIASFGAACAAGTAVIQEEKAAAENGNIDFRRRNALETIFRQAAKDMAVMMAVIAAIFFVISSF